MSRARKKEESELRMYAFFVLYFLHEQGELSGYDLGKMIRERTHGYFTSTAGNVYPVLENLEERELVQSGRTTGNRKKTLFKITPKGRKALHDIAITYKERFDKITSFFETVIGS